MVTDVYLGVFGILVVGILCLAFCVLHVVVGVWCWVLGVWCVAFAILI